MQLGKLLLQTAVDLGHRALAEPVACRPWVRAVVVGSVLGYDRAGWEEIPAVKNQAVYPINDSLVSRPGPRIVEGLVEVVGVLHPNLP